MVPQATNLVQRYRLVTAIIVAVIIAIVMTIFSVVIYVRDGTSRLDLSRPGYEQVRKQIKPDDQSPAFKSEGELTREVMNEFSGELKKKLVEFNQLTTFDVSPLQDDRLKLNVR